MKNLVLLHPGRLTWNLHPSPHEKKGKWSEPNLQWIMVPAVNLQGCKWLVVLSSGIYCTLKYVFLFSPFPHQFKFPWEQGPLGDDSDDFVSCCKKTITVYVESFFAASIHVFGRLTVRAMDNISWFTVGFKLSYMNLQDSEIEILILNNWNKTINKSEWKQTSGGFLKWWYSQNTPKWSFLVGKPMVVGYHHFWKPPSTLW